jgi:hypothetical protein
MHKLRTLLGLEIFVQSFFSLFEPGIPFPLEIICGVLFGLHHFLEQSYWRMDPRFLQ